MFKTIAIVLLSLSVAAEPALADPPIASVQTASPKPDPLAAPPVSDALAFSDQGERMTVPVKISGAGPYGFIVDTGAERTVISRELAGTLGLAHGPDVRLTAMTGTSVVGTVVIPLISVSTLAGERIDAPALEARNLGAAGLLGIDTLQGHAVTIDFVHQQMKVEPATKKLQRENFQTDEIIVHAKSVFGQLVVTDAFYRGGRIQVILDTGSAVTMGNLALRREVVHSLKDLKPISLLSVTGESLQADYTQLPEIKVAGVNFTNLPVAFADAAPFKRFNLVKRPALLLGMDSLKLFRRVRIDFANREVRLVLPDDTIHN